MQSPLITCDPDIMLGKPCIAGTRITVESILAKLAAGETREDLMQAYPGLADEQISAAIDYAIKALRLDVIHPLSVAA